MCTVTVIARSEKMGWAAVKCRRSVLWDFDVGEVDLNRSPERRLSRRRRHLRLACAGRWAAHEKSEADREHPPDDQASGECRVAPAMSAVETRHVGPEEQSGNEADIH